MLVDPKEILFIRKNAPYGMVRTLANNTGLSYEKVRGELLTLKEEWPDELIIEARRLLKANTGLEYTPETAA